MRIAMSLRQLRWFATLYRHASAAAPSTPAWRRAALGAILLALAAGGTRAATLKDYQQVTGATVHLSDLFNDIAPAPDRVLGPAPAPGQRIIVEAPQLAAIARDYSVDWRPDTGAERVVLERAGIRLAYSLVLEKLRAALVTAGAPSDGDISLPGFDAPLLPQGSAADTDVTEASFDPASGRFTAVLNVSAPGMATLRARLSGQVAAMVEAAVLDHRMGRGVVLTAEDLHTARLRASLLRGNMAIGAAAAVGQALRHDVPPGEPLTGADIMRPILVARGGTVAMHLDGGAISLAAQGIALEDGSLGETIRIQNPSSKVVILATVSGDGEVRVNPAHAPIELAAQ